MTLSSVEIVHIDVVFMMPLRESKICSGVMCDARPRDTGLRTTCARDDEYFATAAADRAADGFAYSKAIDKSLK